MVLVEGDGLLMLKVKNLKKSYNSDIVLDSIDINIKSGEIIAIMGPSGCGKSTFIRCINRLVEPDAGEIHFKGTPVHKLSQSQLEEIRQNMGFVFQHFNLVKRLTVKQNVALGLIKKGFNIEKAYQKTKNALKNVDLQDLSEVKVENLSGGEKRRLRLLQLMQGNYNLLILDEPTNHLDLPAREVLEEALNNYPGTVVIVSHDRYFLNKSIDYIYELDAGSLSKYYGNYDHYRQKKEQKQKLKDNKSNKSELNNQDEKKQKSDYFKLKQKSKEKRKKKRKINKLEDSIMEIEDRKKELEEEMIDPENLNNFQLLNELKQEYEKLDKKLKDLYHNWENLI